MARGLGQRASTAPSSSRREALRSAATRLISPLEAGLETPLPEGTGDYLSIPLDEIRPDKTNPRWAGKTVPTWDQIRKPDAIGDSEIRSEVELIHGLAAAIEQVGQRQAIEVCKVDGWFQIVDGERRYWASRLAGKSHVIVKLLPEPPARVKLVQFIATFQHKTFGLLQQLLTLQEIVVEAERAGDPVLHAAHLTRLIGFTKSTGFRWWGILQAPEDVHVAIASGVISSVRDAYLIAQEKDPIKRATMIGDPAHRIPPDLHQPSPKAASKGRGRAARHVSFGRTSSLSLARLIITKLDPEADHGEVNWDDYKQVTHLWKALMDRLEKGLSGDG